MIEVALEASGRPGSVAVRSGAHVSTCELAQDQAHASDLLAALDRLVREIGASPDAIDAVYVGTGPGSFTGLRVAIATAMGLARGSGARVRSVPSFEALALEALAPGERAFVVLDAYSGELYTAQYAREADDVCVVEPPRVVPAAPLEPPHGVRLFGDERGCELAGLADACELELRPSAGAVLQLGAKRLREQGPEDPATVEPLYLRPFAAKARRR